MKKGRRIIRKPADGSGNPSRDLPKNRTVRIRQSMSDCRCMHMQHKVLIAVTEEKAGKENKWKK